jgi:hypothetical protein
VLLHGVNNGGTDQTAALTALTAGETLYVIGQDGHVEVTLDGAPTESGGIVTVTGTIVTDGTPPAGSDAVKVIANATPAPPPAPPDDGDDEPGDDDPDPIVIVVPDPATMFVAEIRDMVTGWGPEDHPDVIAATQQLLDAERAGQNRTSLVEWLDRRTGVV